MNKIKLIVFDLAGTTVQDDNAVAKCLQQAAAEQGLHVAQEEFQKATGTNKINLYQYMIARHRGMQLNFEEFTQYEFPELREEALKIFHRFTEIMLEYFHQHVSAMPGAEDTFRWCHENGIKVATDTGFHHDVNLAIMQGLGWLERGLVDCAVDVEHTGGVGRPAPYMLFYVMQQLGIQSVHEVIKIGDTPADLLSGKNAGCIGNIGVLSGANDALTLGQYAHTHLIQSVAELPALLEREFA